METEFVLRGSLTLHGAPARAWIEIQDDDHILHDRIAAGMTHDDGTFSLRFHKRAFNQQWWEREELPQLSVFIWTEPPEVDDIFLVAPRVPPTHHLRFGMSLWRDRQIDLGALELSEPAQGEGWSMRVRNASNRPGGEWTEAEIQALSDEVLGWVCTVCRIPPQHLPEIPVRLKPMVDGLGAYRLEDKEIWLGAAQLRRLGADAVRRLLVHEWAHAVTYKQHPDFTEEAYRRPDLPRRLKSRIEALCARTDLEAESTISILATAGASANIEGYAHYAEHLVVQEHLPLSSYRIGWSPSERPGLLARVVKWGMGAEGLDMLKMVFGSLGRQEGLRWYQQAHARARGTVRFKRSASRALTARLLEHLERLDGKAPPSQYASAPLEY